MKIGKSAKGSTPAHGYLGSRSVTKSHSHGGIDGDYTRMDNGAVEMMRRKPGMSSTGLSKHSLESDEEMILVSFMSALLQGKGVLNNMIKAGTIAACPSQVFEADIQD